jgi:hypothetical protein
VEDAQEARIRYAVTRRHTIDRIREAATQARRTADALLDRVDHPAAAR